MPAQKTFDFVVVGGGTAGLAVAARLSEDSSVTVAVVEAGEDRVDDERIKIPGRWFLSIGSDLDWNLMSVEQPALYGRKLSQPAGRTVGGSSAINGLAYIYPSKTVTDGWAQLGNPDWTWDTLRPYYRKSHTLALPPAEQIKHLELSHLEISEGCHGPVHAYFASPLTDPIAPAWSQAFKNVGWGAAGNPDAGIVSGGFNSPASIDATSRERTQSGAAYYKPVASRPNLTLFTDTLVERILFETTSQGERATGIQCVESGHGIVIEAKREVILAGGVFGTPKLLELSGVGNPEHLDQHGIETRINLPSVGENMQDHLMTGISYEVNDDVETLDKLRTLDPEATAAAEEAYKKRREGPLALGGFNYFSFMPIDYPASGTDPELERLLTELDAKGNKGLERQYEYLKSVVRSKDKASGGVYLSPRGTTYGASSKASDYSISSLPGKYITIALSLIQPFSRGSSHIASADPRDKQVIDPGYLSNPVDVEVAALHFAFIEKLAKTKPLADLLKPGGRRNAAEARGDTREAGREWARRSVLSNWHACGTCSMLPREANGVVSQRLFVYGTTNVRVVDASVIPIIPAGNPQSSVYMVAERAADIIKEDHGLRT